jgi:hypothetical protein
MRSFSGTRAIVLIVVSFFCWFSLASAQSTPEPKAAAEVFLNKLYAGDLGSLYETSLSGRAKALLTKENFIQFVNVWRIQIGGPAQSRLFVGGTPLNQIQGGPTGDFYYIRFREGYPVGQVFTDITLEKEGQAWVVFAYNFSPAPQQ